MSKRKKRKRDCFKVEEAEKDPEVTLGKRLPWWLRWVNHLSAMQETQVQSLGWEDPLEKEMATHSSTLAWKIPWTEELGRLQSMGSQRVRHDWVTSLEVFTMDTEVESDPKETRGQNIEGRRQVTTSWHWNNLGVVEKQQGGHWGESKINERKVKMSS